MANRLQRPRIDVSKAFLRIRGTLRRLLGVQPLDVLAGGSRIGEGLGERLAVGPDTPAPLEADCIENFETGHTLLATLGYPIFDPVAKTGTVAD